MKRISLTLVAALSLAGCSAGVSSPEAAPVPSPTPTIDLGPVELTDEQAGERYLQTVCQTNAAGSAISDAIIAGEPEWLDGGSPDPSAVNAAASESLRVVRLAIEVFDDDYYVWPDSVASQIGYIRDSFVGELGTIDSIANASRFEDAYYTSWPERTPEQAGAGQEVRYQLGIGADTTESCVGYEAALDGVYTEMQERIAYLATFDSVTD